MNSTQRALLVDSIQEGIMNPVKDMPDPEELFAKILKEEINLELWVIKKVYLQALNIWYNKWTTS